MDTNKNSHTSPRLSGIDITDTGQWHLIIYISQVMIRAWLRPKPELNLPGIELFKCEWEENREGILHEIENAVYDHPRVLDDFSADIIIETAKCLWVPREIGETDCGYEDTFSLSFPEDTDEMSIDELKKETCLYMLTSGLKGFLQRTFPGTRIRSHQGWLAGTWLSKRGEDNPEIYCDIRSREADIFLKSSGRMEGCLTRAWNEPTDIAWYCFNLLNLNSIDPKKTKIILSGNEVASKMLEEIISPYVDMVIQSDIPEIPGIEDMPLAARFCYLKTERNENNQR